MEGSKALDATPIGMLTAAVRLNEAAVLDGLNTEQRAALAGLALSYYDRACQMLAPVRGGDVGASLDSEIEG